MPDGDLGRFIGGMIESGALLPVNIDRLNITDLHNAYRNSDEHMLLCIAVTADQTGKAVLDKLFKVSRRVRHASKMLLIWRRVPLAKAAVDKYRKAIAKDYPAMIEAGSVLVMIDEPRNVNLYKSLCTNNYE